ncbi:hypothetical protein EN947_16260 [Mesorhizobium sp. M7A.F.Ca.US.003.02.2.1]|nr:hypothetical protein EN949_28920 [Mesorhizobium sp. M7A.F.Ca.US.007.01.2.1]RUZ83232.1 hypothetical protein EN947_16260 [Mesorhizobium sp. M7A.F.Ca.US.003.02.2.1]
MSVPSPSPGADPAAPLDAYSRATNREIKNKAPRRRQRGSPRVKRQRHPQQQAEPSRTAPSGLPEPALRFRSRRSSFGKPSDWLSVRCADHSSPPLKGRSAASADQNL